MMDRWTPELSTKIGKLVRLLASDKDGETLAAVRALERTLKSADLDLNELAGMIEALRSDWYEIGYSKGLVDGFVKARQGERKERPGREYREAQPPPMDWRSMARYCAARLHRVEPKHRQFIITMKDIPTWKNITEKQKKYVRDLYNHVLECEAV